MDVDELIARAWAAVDKAGVPGSAQAAALIEAVRFLRETEADPAKPAKRQPGDQGGQSSREVEVDSKTGGAGKGEFYERLEHESGIPVAALKEVLQLDGDEVRVLAPARNLGSNKAEQARTIVALVASARLYGLDEDPVDANAVRAEVKKARALDSNFAVKGLGKMKGFKAGAKRSQIVVTAAWLEEFRAAVNRVRGTQDE